MSFEGGGDDAGEFGVEEGELVGKGGEDESRIS